jgi:hypothetical protein
MGPLGLARAISKMLRNLLKQTSLVFDFSERICFFLRFFVICILPSFHISTGFSVSFSYSQQTCVYTVKFSVAADNQLGFVSLGGGNGEGVCKRHRVLGFEFCCITP